MGEFFGFPVWPLIGGFIFIKFFNWTKVRAPRYSGYQFLFFCGAAAAFFEVFATIIIALSGELAELLQSSLDVVVVPQLIERGYASQNLFMLCERLSSENTIFTTHFRDNLSFSLASSAWWFWNKKLDLIEVTDRAIQELGTPLEKLLLDAQIYDRLVAVTLEDRKVYIGYAIEAELTLQAIENQKSYLTILPVLSGFRDESDLRIAGFTMYYYRAWSDLAFMEQQGLYKEDFFVTIPESRILSVSQFYEEVCDRYQAPDGEVL